MYLAVDIGATNTRLALGDEEAEDFSYVEKMSSDPLYVETGDDFVSTLEHLIDETLDSADIEREDIDSIGIAGPGPVDRDKGTFDPFFFEPSAVDLSPLKDIGEVYMHNDVKVAGIGEYTYGGHETENMVYVTMSSGIGGAAILDGELVEGKKGNAGEVGHLEVDYESEVGCGCGGTGHWHALCGGEGLPEMAEEEFDHSFDDAAEIFERFEASDSEAAEVVERFQEYNSRAVEAIVDMYNPDMIVFGGAVATNNRETVIEALEEDVEPINEVPEFRTAELGDDAGLHGARALCTGDFKPGFAKL